MLLIDFKSHHLAAVLFVGHGRAEGEGDKREENAASHANSTRWLVIAVLPGLIYELRLQFLQQQL